MHPHVQTWGSILRLYGSKMNEPLLEDQVNLIKMF
jgi:hypothetical protein